MSQTHRINRNNTTVTTLPDGTRVVVLHKTPVVTAHADGRVTFCTGGWFTATTRTRINQVCSEWGIPWRVGFTKAANAARNYVTGEVREFVGDSLTV